MKLTVYTAIFGDYETLKEPLFNTPSVDYICFTDKHIESKMWDVRVVKTTEQTPRREARKYKILSHKYIEDTITLWIDGSKFIKSNPFPWIKKALGYCDVHIPSHPIRNCIYEEAIRCLQVRKGNPLLIKQQVDRYKAEKYPKNNGMVHSTVVLRNRTPDTIKLEKIWWEELSKGCVRDQVSFNYAVWKSNVKYKHLYYRKFIGGGGGHN
jgi:hypothetical protein